MINPRCMPLVAGALLVAVSSVSAQVRPPACTEPAKPESLSTQESINNWARVVEEYQRCLTDYADRQKKLSDAYAKAANDAVGRWNRFVQQMSQ